MRPLNVTRLSTVAISTAAAAPDPAAAGPAAAGGGAATTAVAGVADRGVVGGEGERRTTSAHERGLASGEEVEDEEENIGKARTEQLFGELKLF